MRICGNNSRKRLGILCTTAKININKKKFVHHQKMDVLLMNGEREQQFNRILLQFPSVTR